MAINPALTQRLVQVAQAAACAPGGTRQAVYAAACAQLSISPATLHRQLAKVTVKPPRKQRSDAGSVELTRPEAVAISAMLMSSHRKNNKRLMSIGQAVDVLRANGEVRAQRICPATGEVLALSDSAIARALRTYSLHPDQLNRPTPAVELKSLHPNHVWQVDASLCVLYYLNARTQAEAGLQVMERDKFYKNKPANLKRIEADRVWSYEITDHYSSAIYVHYVLGAESGANLAEAFIAATQKRADDPFHGVPFILMMDMGSANTSGLFSNLARRLQVKTIAHAPGNARATGQVEKARDLIERSFESGLSLRPVASLEELNQQAQRWARWYNATKVHTRHGKTRYQAWMCITAEQLRLAPPVAVCQALLTETPETRKVSDTLTVSFKGREFDVRDVPGVMIGEKLHIATNPYVPDAATVVDTDEAGQERLHTIPLVARDEAGFRADANVIGEDYQRPANTTLEGNRAEVERFVMDAATDQEAQAARRAKALPFGGRIDPLKVIDQAPEVVWLPRHGTALEPAVTTSASAAPERLLSVFEAAQQLRTLHGVDMTREKYQQINAWHPHGVSESDLPALAQSLAVRATLRVVGGH